MTKLTRLSLLLLDILLIVGVAACSFGEGVRRGIESALTNATPPDNMGTQAGIGAAVGYAIIAALRGGVRIAMEKYNDRHSKRNNRTKED